MATTTTVSTDSRAKARGLMDARRANFYAQYLDPEYFADPRNDIYKLLRLRNYGHTDVTDAEFNRKLLMDQAGTVGPRAVATMNEVLRRAPTISPGLAASLSTLAETIAVPDGVLDRILTLDAQARTPDPEETGRKPGAKSSAEEGGAFASVVGEVTRPLFALLSLPVEMVTGSFRHSVGAHTPGSGHPLLGGDIGPAF